LENGRSTIALPDSHCELKWLLKSAGGVHVGVAVGAGEGVGDGAVLKQFSADSSTGWKYRAHA